MQVVHLLKTLIKGSHMPIKRDVLLPDHPAYTNAVEALRLYHEAQRDGASAIEVERLRQIAESLFQAVTDHQLRALGKPGGTIH